MRDRGRSKITIEIENTILREYETMNLWAMENIRIAGTKKYMMLKSPM